MKPMFFLCMAVVSSRTLFAAESDTGLFAVSYSLRTNAAPMVEVATQSTSQADLALTSTPLLEVPVQLATQRYEAMNGGRLLVVPEPQFEPGGAYGVMKRAVFDPITTPEVVKVGKVQMTGGVVGALKKKNPFYLLNPLVFALDW